MADKLLTEDAENVAVPSDPLTDWKKEPDISTLKSDIELAKPFHREHTDRIDAWLNNLNITGAAKLPQVKGRSNVQPKLIRKQAEWRYGSLSEPFLSSDKLFTVKPVSWEDTKAAKQNEVVLNWQFQTKINSVKLVDEYVRTIVDEGTVIFMVGWDRESTTEKVMAPIYSYYQMTDPEEVKAITEAGALESENPNAFADLPEDVQESVRYSLEKGSPFKAEQVGEQEVEQEKLLRNQPTVEIIDTKNLVIDATCEGDASKAMFMAYSREVTRGSLISDGRYKNLDKVQWSTNTILGEPDHTTTTPLQVNFKDQARQKVVMTMYWGLYDIDGDGLMTPFLACWIGNTIVRMEKNPFPDKKSPFVIVPYLPIKKSVYGEPDGELLEDNQKILGAITRGIIDMMARSANGQRGMAKNMLDVPNRRKFDDGKDYEFNPGVHPSNGMVEHKFPEIPGSAMGMLGQQNAEAESLTGVKTYAESGLTGDSLGATAAGTRGVLAASDKREMGILRRLAKGMAEVGSKIASMNQEFMSEEEIVRVTNEEFVTIRRDELQGTFDFSVAIATVEEDAAKSQKLAFMLQTMGPNMDLNITKMIMSEISRLDRMPALSHAIERYEPQVDPLDQKKKELEIAELEAKIQKLMADAAESAANAALDNARARAVNSTADKQDLDYVEQETGTKHARDVDRIKAQSKGNEDLEVTKAILNQRNGDPSNPEHGKDTAPTEGNIATAIGYNAVRDAQDSPT